MTRSLSWFACLLLFVGLTPRVHAHDGIPEQILSVSAEIAAEPGRADLYVRRADLRRQLSKFDEAERDLQVATRLAPEAGALDLVAARLARDQQHPDAAMEAASRYLAREPNHVEALLILGRAAGALHQRRNAVTALSRALALQPNPDVFIERATLLAEAGALAEAVEGLDDGIRRLGPLVTLELAAIDLDRQLRRFDSAIARVDRMASGTARTEPWLARRGVLLEDAGRPDEALASYRAALAAIDTLLPARRSTRATLDLTTDLTARITRLTADPASARGSRRLSR